MSTSIPYVYQYQRNEMFNIGTSVQRPDFVQTTPNTNPSNLSSTQALGFPSSLVNAPLNSQGPLTTPLLGLPLLPQTTGLNATQGLTSLRSVTAPTSPPEATNAVQTKLAALQPPPLSPEQVLTGPFANADKALSQQLAANRGIEIVNAGTTPIEKPKIIPPAPPRVEDRILQMPPTSQSPTANSSTANGMFGMMARLHEMFSTQVRNPTEGQGGQAGYMNMGSSHSGGESHHQGQQSQRRQQTTSRFSAMA